MKMKTMTTQQTSPKKETLQMLIVGDGMLGREVDQH